MAQIKNIAIHTSDLANSLILDDVSREDSINPRTAISAEYVSNYEESIIGYLADGKDFNKSWNQKPEAVTTNEEGKYLLTSGYHTITALMGVIAKVGQVATLLAETPNAELSKDEKIISELSIDFDINFGVRSHGKFPPEESARYFASFSNIHGQNLTSGEKSKSAYNALSVMNLRKDEADENFRPFLNDRELASLLGVSKSTISNQRQILLTDRYGLTEDDNVVSDDETTEDVVATVEGLEDDAPETDLERQDGGEQEASDADVAKGTDGIDIPDTDVPVVSDDAKKVSKNSTKEQSAKDVRKAIDNIFDVEFSADDRLDSVVKISRQIEKGRERVMEKYNKNDDAYFKTSDRLYSALLTLLDCVSNENENL